MTETLGQRVLRVWPPTVVESGFGGSQAIDADS